MKFSAACVLSVVSVLCVADDAVYAEFQQFCPEGDHRVVDVEFFDGCQFGWVRMVCLDNVSQRPSHWFLSPNDQVVSSQDVEMPSCRKPELYTALLLEMESIPEGERIYFWLRFKYDESMVSKPADMDSYLSSSGSNSPSIFMVNGLYVTEAEYDEVEKRNDERLKKYRQEKIESLVKPMLSELIELNSLQGRIDQSALNNNDDSGVFWINSNPSLLAIDLNLEEVRSIIETSGHLVEISTRKGVTDLQERGN